MTKQDLVHTIIDGIQDSKGLNIVVADLSKLENTICNYMIICEGNSNTHVNASIGPNKLVSATSASI